MKESTIQSLIMLALSEAGCTVWRNETAGAWVGRVIHQSHGTVTIADARMIQAGLCVGGADIIGIEPGGRFLAVEVKSATGRARPEQIKFMDAVIKAGGIAGIARSVDDALELIR